MKKIRMLLLLLGSVGSLVVAIYCEVKSIPVGTMLGSLVAGIVIPYLLQSIVDLTDNTNWKTTQRKLKRAGLLQKDTIIRISFAYLFRIKIDGKYFLVKSPRTKKYQPVGGAYKFYAEEAAYLRDNIPVENDNRIPVNEITKRDYRLLVKNKDLRKFVRRFNKTIYRENIPDLSRDFIEEIFSTGILDKETYGTLSYKFCGRHMTDVAYGSVFGHYELLFADIIEVQLSDRQEQLFRELSRVKSGKYCFATADEIKALGVKYNTNDMSDNIGNHTFKVLNENSDKLTMANDYKEIVNINL